MAFKHIIVKNKFISTVIGTLAVYLSIAFVFPINNFSVYITSFIHINQEFVTMHYGMFINLIFSFSMSFSHPLGGIFENYVGFFKTIFLGLLILLIASILFIYQQNIWLCYGLSLFMGIGAGISTSLLGKNLIFYVPDKKGMITGILGLGIVIITAVFTFGGEKVINYEGYTLKENENYYPNYISERTYIYFIVGIITIPIGYILSFLFIHEYKVNQDENPNSENEKTTSLIIENKEEEKNIENNSSKEVSPNENEVKENSSKYNIKKAIKNLRLYRISLISLLINFSISFIGNTGRTFGALIGINGNALQFLMVFQAFSIIISLIILGALVDKKGPLFILRIVSFICIIPGILLAFFMDVTWIFMLAFIINVLGISGLLVGFAPLIMEIYGIQESVILGGIINAFSKFSEVITTITAFIVSIFYKSVEELKVPYKILYLTSSICCGLSAILLFFETNEKFNYNFEIPEELNYKIELERESIQSKN